MKLGTKKEESIGDLFNQLSSTLKDAFEFMSLALTAYANDEHDKKLDYIKETIIKEKEQDRLREKITVRIFSKETMVFSREDRLGLIDDLDDIVDKAEIVVRKLKLHSIPLNPELKKGFVNISIALAKIGIEMDALVQSVLRDFEKGKDHIKNITDIRREIREIHWELLENTYRIKDDYLSFHYFHNLIKAMCTCADEVEEVSDEIYTLICKYTF